MFDRFIALIADGEWHQIDKTMEKAGIKPQWKKSVLTFLAEYQFIEVDDDKLRASARFLKFLRELKAIEEHLSNL